MVQETWMDIQEFTRKYQKFKFSRSFDSESDMFGQK